MAENDHVRIEIAFDGGQTIGALVTPAVAEGLESALASTPDGVYELEAEDGRYAIALRRVVYVKRFAREMRIGFAGAA
jgi:hypothetical protein